MFVNTPVIYPVEFIEPVSVNLNLPLPPVAVAVIPPSKFSQTGATLRTRFDLGAAIFTVIALDIQPLASLITIVCTPFDTGRLLKEFWLIKNPPFTLKVYGARPPKILFAVIVVVVPLQRITPPFILAEMFTPAQAEGGGLIVQLTINCELVLLHPRVSVTVIV